MKSSARLDFDLAVTLGPGRRGHPAVRLAVLKKKGSAKAAVAPARTQRDCQGRQRMPYLCMNILLVSW
jgi:hypothetical protein